MSTSHSRVYILLQLFQNLSGRPTGGHQLLDGFLQLGSLSFLRSLSIGFCFLFFQLGQLIIQLLQLSLLGLQVGLDGFQILFQGSNVSCETLFGCCLLSDECGEVGGGCIFRLIGVRIPLISA